MEPVKSFQPKLKKQQWIKLLLLIISFLLLVYLFLIMPNLSHRTALKGLRNYNYAHRGLFDNDCFVPENSLLAFQKAVDHGYGIELDVQLTKDQVPVVVHDYNLQRLTGKNILVSALTYEELRQYRLLDTNEAIPTLQETLSLIKGDVPVMIELKAGLTYIKTCEAVGRLLRTYNGSYCIISFSPLALKWFRENMPTVVRGQLSTNYFKDNMKNIPILQFMLTHLMFNALSRPDFISYNYKHFSNPSLNICKRLFACPAAAWTIRSPEEYQEASKHSDMLVFDHFMP